MKTLLQQESGYATELWTSSSTFYTWKFAQMNAKPVAMFGDYYIGIYFETNSSSVFNVSLLTWCEELSISLLFSRDLWELTIS